MCVCFFRLQVAQSSHNTVAPHLFGKYCAAPNCKRIAAEFVRWHVYVYFWNVAARNGRQSTVPTRLQRHIFGSVESCHMRWGGRDLLRKEMAHNAFEECLGMDEKKNTNMTKIHERVCFMSAGLSSVLWTGGQLTVPTRLQKHIRDSAIGGWDLWLFRGRRNTAKKGTNRWLVRRPYLD